MSHIPVALITGTPLQTEWVRVTMKIMPDQDRKRVVKTMDEAIAFIDEFHQKRVSPPVENAAVTDAPEAASIPAADTTSDPKHD